MGREWRVYKIRGINLIMRRHAIESFGLSDKGQRRKRNEDCIGVFDEIGLYIVADGMGGHLSGDIASRMAVELIAEGIKKLKTTVSHDVPVSSQEILVQAFINANRKIYRVAIEDPKLKGMGATIVGALFGQYSVSIAHLGDCRAYLIREDDITLLTTDHSLVHMLLSNNQITPEEAKNHAMKNVVTRALGVKEDVEVEVSHHQCLDGDIYLFCSDGLTNELEDDDILEIYQQGRGDIEASCRLLVEEANRRGGKDNISVLIVRRVDIEK